MDVQNCGTSFLGVGRRSKWGAASCCMSALSCCKGAILCIAAFCSTGSPLGCAGQPRNPIAMHAPRLAVGVTYWPRLTKPQCISTITLDRTHLYFISYADTHKLFRFGLSICSAFLVFCISRHEHRGHEPSSPCLACGLRSFRRG